MGELCHLPSPNCTLYTVAIQWLHIPSNPGTFDRPDSMLHRLIEGNGVVPTMLRMPCIVFFFGFGWDSLENHDTARQNAWHICLCVLE